MMKRIVILGGGTSGTLIANRLRRLLDRDAAEITVVDVDDQHLYQPGLLFVPFGLAKPASLIKPRRRHHQARALPGAFCRRPTRCRRTGHADQVPGGTA